MSREDAERLHYLGQWILALLVVGICITIISGGFKMTVFGEEGGGAYALENDRSD